MYHQKLIILLTVMLIGLFGCSKDNETVLQERRTERTVPIGYYSNENHENKGGNALMLDGADNDGPATEMMDHTFGGENNNSKSVRRDNQERSYLGGSDRNYHGHNMNSDNATKQSNHTKNMQASGEKISQAAEKVYNVKDAATLIEGNQVIITVILKKNVNLQKTKQDILEEVRPYTKSAPVQIRTTQS